MPASERVTPQAGDTAADELTSIALYAERGYPWALWDELRRQPPVYWEKAPDYDPFWAITRYDDVLTISRHPEVFVNSGRLRIFTHLEDLLMREGVEEILRWTSTVIQFARTAVADFPLNGVLIRAGEDVGMFYPSANRDDAVFEEPYRFDVTRNPNHHIAFGHGAHFCLGANLARLELQAMLTALLPTLPDLAVAGDPQRVAHLHVGGIKALHVRLAHRSIGEREDHRSGRVSV